MFQKINEQFGLRFSIFLVTTGTAPLAPVFCSKRIDGCISTVVAYQAERLSVHGRRARFLAVKSLSFTLWPTRLTLASDCYLRLLRATGYVMDRVKSADSRTRAARDLLSRIAV